MDLDILMLVLLTVLLAAVIYLLLEVVKLKSWVSLSKDDLKSMTASLSNVFSDVARLLEITSSSKEALVEKFSEVKTRLEEVYRAADAARELKEMLRAPKGKGAFGELSLYAIISDSLPQSAYEFQYVFKNGSKADAVIKINGRILAIDSKFPADNYAKLLTENDPEKRKSLISSLKSEIKNLVKVISTKYINPAEGTFDFALMFLPSEALYHEIVTSDEFEEIYQYFRQNNVYPVSPNTFYVFVAGISYLLRQLRFERNLKEVLESVRSLERDLEKLKSEFGTFQNHFRNASNALVRLEGSIGSLEKRLQEAVNIAEEE